MLDPLAADRIDVNSTLIIVITDNFFTATIINFIYLSVNTLVNAGRLGRRQLDFYYFFLLSIYNSLSRLMYSNP